MSVILQLAAQHTWDEEKRRHLRGISTAGHIAVTIRGCNGTLYEIVTTNCEAKLVIILGLKVDQLIGGDDQTYSIGHRIPTRQA